MNIVKGSPRDRAFAVRLVLLSSSVILWLFSSYCYYTRADWCAAFTFWPPWVWLGAGMALALSATQRKTLRPALLATTVWVFYAGAFVEEAWSILWPGRWLNERQTWSLDGPKLRVVSLNCAGGDADAAREVIALDPDLVLLQETPSVDAVEALGEEMFGSHRAVVVGLDAAVIARGRLVGSYVPRKVATFVTAHVVLQNGVELKATSLRLMPPPLRTDLWSPTCWNAYRSDRASRRVQMQRIADHLRQSRADELANVCGGDFNAPAGDGILQIMPSFLRDSFSEGGRGWGNTVINDFPISRFDQVWVSPHFVVSRVVARRTRNSDHRMAICDVVVPGRGTLGSD